MEVTIIESKTLLKYLQPGEIFSHAGDIYIKGFCYGDNDSFTCTILETGRTSDLLATAEVVRAKQSQCMVEF